MNIKKLAQLFIQFASSLHAAKLNYRRNRKFRGKKYVQKRNFKGRH